MTVRVQEFLKNKNLPSFLSNNKVLLSFDKVDKVFPGIGLPNCKEDVVLDNTPFIKASAVQLLNILIYFLEIPDRELNNYKLYYSDRLVPDERGNCRIPIDKYGDICHYGSIVRSLYRYMLRVDNQERMVVNKNGKFSLRLPNDVHDDIGRVLFKANESIFKIYNKVYNKLLELKCGVRIDKLDSIPEFKRFSSDNLPHNQFQIVFSSDGLDGLWDIATMSQRGVTSCQSWNGQYKNNLVGSIVDPFVGILYLTSGTNMDHLGTKMVKRSIVRFVVQSDTKEPKILIDNIYPSFDQDIKDKFIEFMQKKVGDKIKVYYGPDYIGFEPRVYIPASKVHEKLTVSTRSYRDTKIPYKIDIPTETSKLEKNLQVKKTKFRNMLRNTSFDAVNHINKNVDFGNDDMQETMKTIIHSHDFKYLIKDYYRDIAEKIIETGPSNEDVLTSKEYMRRLCYHYLKDRDNTTRCTRIAFAKKLNKYFDGKIPVKVNTKNLFKILVQIQKHIDNNIKKELKSLLSKKNIIVKLPN